MVNWTIEVFITSFSSIMMISSCGVILNQNRKFPDRALIFMALSWVLFGLFQAISAISYLLLNQNIFIFKNIVLSLMLLSAQVTINLITTDKAINLALLGVSFIAAFNIFIILLDGNSEIIQFPNGDYSIANAGLTRVFMSIIFAYVMILYFYFSIKIFVNAPLHMKSKIRMYIIGNIILGPISFIAFVTKISQLVPGIVDLFLGTGIMVSTIGLIMEPKMLYVLPFKAIKISAINQETGMILYNYNWNINPSNMSNALFASALLSINMFAKESIGQGNIKEVALENATLIINSPPDQTVYYVIVATKPSHSLKVGLEQFSRKFYDQYGVYLTREFISVSDVSLFKSANSLIRECFPYIPGFNRD
ncbi:MAG: hypothetical protein INQ03_20150 [Candidatus Heimdallarchaeota archaeon]|nr:hypothetical protein [Candidatus Heimdallarchaeota archaeon]